ncbi:MAG: RidA family protein, partial [Flavobacteriaceae bacterium]
NKRTLEIALDAEDHELIRAAQKLLKPIPGGCGDEYRKPPFLTASGDLSDHLEHMPLPYSQVENVSNRAQIFSGTEWEGFAGYCRAIKADNRIYVSGTTATHEDKLIGGDDAAAQTHFVIDKIEGAITSLGGSLADVVRTRIFVHDIAHWEAVARAHGERFKNINPANTLVEGKLVGEGYLVEIEAEAVIS